MRLRSSAIEGAAIFAATFVILLLAHLPLLKLPYFWDEAGYYIPAARDLWRDGALIPHSTVSNAHPPLVMAWLALCWKLFGNSIVVTRCAMVAVASYALTGLFFLARLVSNWRVALGAIVCTAVYPVFFAQASLAHVDMAAAAFTFWALYAYATGKIAATSVYMCLAVLSKETAILAVVGLLVWDFVRPRVERRFLRTAPAPGFSAKTASSLAAPFFVLAAWYAYHFHRTGYLLGNPEFFRYNVAATISFTRILLAGAMRVWQSLGYMNLIVLTVAAGLAMYLEPAKDAGVPRTRIAFSVQLSWAAILLAYVTALAVIGGAVLARYMLTVVPLVIVLCVSTLYRRIRPWKLVLVAVVAAFVAALLINPPYGFSPEDNLAYADFVRLHEESARYIESRYPASSVLTAWPASDELARPYLGYVEKPVKVVQIEDFSLEQLLSARDQQNLFDVAMVFSTKYDPPHGWLADWRPWLAAKTRFFGYHRDLPPQAAASLLGGKLVFEKEKHGEWVGVIEMPHVEEARLLKP